MTLQDLGAIGELLGAVGVILTLLYLTGQLRQNTKAMQSATMQAYNASSLSIADSFVGIADVLAKLEAGEKLSAEERIRFNYSVIPLFSNMETAYLQHKNGSLDSEVFEARMKGFKQALKTEGIRLVWSGYREFDLTKSFVDYVDTELREDA
jgi:hypothetical protein